MAKHIKIHQGQQLIGQLEKRKGGYFYLKIEKELVSQFKNDRHTRLICTIDHSLSIQCGLNHLGDGNFFIIISNKNLKLIRRQPGDTVSFELIEDPNPLGIEIPEAIEALLAQDQTLNDKFSALTDGKKRSILVQTGKIKDIDKQISRTVELINHPSLQRHKRR